MVVTDIITTVIVVIIGTISTIIAITGMIDTVTIDNDRDPFVQ